MKNPVNDQADQGARPPHDADGAAEQQQGALARFHNLYVRNGQGTAFRVTVLAPHAPAALHRPETVDYDVVLSGELDLHLDDRTGRLTAGDAVVVRGALHGWSNPGAEPASIAFVMVDAAPVVVEGETLGQHYSPDSAAS